MNSNIIPQGPSELIIGPSVGIDNILVCEAMDASVVENVVFISPRTPPDMGTTNTTPMAPNGRLYNVKSLDLVSGTLFVVYRH